MMPLRLQQIWELESYCYKFFGDEMIFIPELHHLRV
jgi:hypothetical protein